jgi:hypothetical protein
MPRHMLENSPSLNCENYEAVSFYPLNRSGFDLAQAFKEIWKDKLVNVKLHFSMICVI